MVTYVAIAVIIVIAAILIYKQKKREKKMPAGLQIFDADGKLVLDYTEATCQIYGTKTIVGSKNGSGTIVDKRIKANNTFIIPYNITLDGVSPKTVYEQYYAQAFATQPTFIISDGQITWKYDSVRSEGAYVGMSIMYGGNLS